MRYLAQILQVITWAIQKRWEWIFYGRSKTNEQD